MMPSIGTTGLADVQTRIAAIQGRMNTFMPAAAPVATDANAAAPAASFSATLAATAAGGRPDATVSGAGATVSTTTAASTSTATGAWASRLPAEARHWAGAIEQAATEAGIDPALLASLVKHESGFDPTARSHAGAIGLAQLMPGTAAGLGVDATDPLSNLRGGAKFLKAQLDRFGSPELALAAYNAGPGRVAEAGGIPRISETQTYVKRVMNTWEQLR